MKSLFEVISILLKEREEVNIKFKYLLNISSFKLLYQIFKATLSINILLMMLLILMSSNTYSLLLLIPISLHIVMFLMFKNALITLISKLLKQ